MFANILVPIDTTDKSTWRQALPEAIRLAHKETSRVHLMTVIPEYLLRGYYADLAIDSKVEETRKILAKIVNEIDSRGVRVTIGVERGGIYPEVLRVARDLPADVIVMASHRPQMKDYLLGSNAAHIVLHAHCSVFVVRENSAPFTRAAVMEQEVTTA